MASVVGDMARVVIALGGNTLLDPTGGGPVDQQIETIETTATEIVAAIEAGHEVVLTHGNGPQIGNLLLQQEAAPDTPQLPLDVLVAETQAQIGYLLQQALDNQLAGAQDFLTVVTQVVVEANDPAFDEPTKPIGPFYAEAEAADKPFATERVGTGDRSYRRLVPSPQPVEIVEADEIAGMVDRGNHVICGGGGGVPVVDRDGYTGIEAVIDKDLTSQVLATAIGADRLVILTDVEFAYLDFNAPDRRPLETVTPSDLEPHLDAGQFGAGSMRPKIEASRRFVERGGDLAAISTPARLMPALDGTAGTRVRADLQK